MAFVPLTVLTAEALNTAFGEKVDATEKGAPIGVATLDANGDLPREQLPELVIADVTGLQASLDGKQAAGSYEPAGTAASTMVGHEVAVDPHPQYTTAGEAAAVAPVQSVAGRTGAVNLAKADVGLANVDNTSDANKPISTATQAALNGKAATSHAHIISDVTGLQTALEAKAGVSHTHAIANVTGLQTALDGKAASSHTHAIADVTNLQTTLDGKAPTADPTFTGAIYDNGSVRGNVVAVGTGSTINCSLGNYFTRTMSSNWTPTISNLPTSQVIGFVIELSYSSGALTLPSGWSWAGGASPSLTSGVWMLTWVRTGSQGIVTAQKRGA